MGFDEMLDKVNQRLDEYERLNDPEIIWAVFHHRRGDSRAALDSALLRSGQEELRLRDLLDAPLTMRQTQLVVLSACQSSSVDEQLPAESLNLSTGMIAAGARATIGTLWPVPDESSAATMTAFYRELASGRHPQQAFTTHSGPSPASLAGVIRTSRPVSCTSAPETPTASPPM